MSLKLKYSCFVALLISLFRLTGHCGFQRTLNAPCVYMTEVLKPLKYTAVLRVGCELFYREH